MTAKQLSQMLVFFFLHFSIQIRLFAVKAILGLKQKQNLQFFVTKNIDFYSGNTVVFLCLQS